MGSFSQGIPNPTATHIGIFSPVDWVLPLEKTNGKAGPMRRARPVALVQTGQKKETSESWVRGPEQSS